MVLRWVVLVAGVVLYSTSAAGVAVAYGNERVPRGGFWLDLRTHRAPWWTWVLFTVGTSLMIFGSMGLAGTPENPWRYLLVVLPCLTVSWLVQAAIFGRHNRRVARRHPERTEL